MTSKERVIAAVRRQGPDRTPYLRWEKLEVTDIVADWPRKKENLTRRQTKWTDEWGCQWEALDTSRGHIVGYPIVTVDDYADYVFPEPVIPLEALQANRLEFGDRICCGGLGFFFFELLEKLRGFNEFMVDLAGEREALEAFLDRLQAHYIKMVDAYAASGLVDCITTNEDLGLQDRLTISPAMWREVLAPRYRAVYQRAHEHGLLTFQHSCGFVQDIVGDLADAGVDILELQQLGCMDMELVARQARDRLCISAPVDVQTVLPCGDWAKIEAFQRRLFETFDAPAGGFIAQIYCDLPSLQVPPETGDRLETLIQSLRDWRGR